MIWNVVAQRDNSQWENNLSVLISFTLATCHEKYLAGVGKKVCHILDGKVRIHVYIQQWDFRMNLFLKKYSKEFSKT